MATGSTLDSSSDFDLNLEEGHAPEASAEKSGPMPEERFTPILNTAAALSDEQLVMLLARYAEEPRWFTLEQVQKLAQQLNASRKTISEELKASFSMGIASMPGRWVIRIIPVSLATPGKQWEFMAGHHREMLLQPAKPSGKAVQGLAAAETRVIRTGNGDKGMEEKRRAAQKQVQTIVKSPIPPAPQREEKTETQWQAQTLAALLATLRRNCQPGGIMADLPNKAATIAAAIARVRTSLPEKDRTDVLDGAWVERLDLPGIGSVFRTDARICMTPWNVLPLMEEK